MKVKIITLAVVLCILASIGIAQQMRSRDAEHRKVERELGVLTDPEVDVNLTQEAEEAVQAQPAETQEDTGLEKIRVEETKKEVEEWDKALEENREKKPGETQGGFIEWRDDSGKLHEEKVR